MNFTKQNIAELKSALRQLGQESETLIGAFNWLNDQEAVIYDTEAAKKLDEITVALSNQGFSSSAEVSLGDLYVRMSNKSLGSTAEIFHGKESLSNEELSELLVDMYNEILNAAMKKVRS